jgi:hypothetical protein
MFILIGILGTGNSQTISIGSQVWDTKNLEVSTFRNGDPIREIKTNEEEKNNVITPIQNIKQKSSYHKPLNNNFEYKNLE